MIVAAAFCPQPPLLHPTLLGSDGQEMGAALRVACADALSRVQTLQPDAVLVLGRADAPSGAAADPVEATGYGQSEVAEFGPGDAGDLIGYGGSVRVGFHGPPTPDAARLPLAHTLGAWLLDEAGFAGHRVGVVAGRRSPHLESAGPDGRRWALLVMGDGSARRTEKSPGWYDPAAVAFDDGVIAALTSGDGSALLDLDLAVGDRVLAAGLPSWRAAGAILENTPMTARLHYADAPFGVMYVVASWVGTDTR